MMVGNFSVANLFPNFGGPPTPDHYATSGAQPESPASSPELYFRLRRRRMKGETRTPSWWLRDPEKQRITDFALRPLGRLSCQGRGGISLENQCGLQIGSDDRDYPHKLALFRWAAATSQVCQQGNGFTSGYFVA